jgi:hypothetical protein
MDPVLKAALEMIESAPQGSLCELIDYMDTLTILTPNKKQGE